MIVPSAMNVLIIGLSAVVFAFLWRALAAFLVRKGHDNVGGAMAVAL